MRPKLQPTPGSSRKFAKHSVSDVVTSTSLHIIFAIGRSFVTPGTSFDRTNKNHLGNWANKNQMVDTDRKTLSYMFGHKLQVK